jgi:hypothetical protein
MNGYQLEVFFSGSDDFGGILNRKWETSRYPESSLVGDVIDRLPSDAKNFLSSSLTIRTNKLHRFPKDLITTRPVKASGVNFINILRS